MKILLINPPIYDFAAYDMWGKPLGLLYIASMLKLAGVEVSLIDCLDRHHRSLPRGAPKERAYGVGKYPAELIDKPDILSFIPRYYRRYGISKEALIGNLQQHEKPDAILITSRMTYWYQGVIEAVSLCREHFPGVPLLLGGTYATLMPAHALGVTGVERVVVGEGEMIVFDILSDILGRGLDCPDISLNDLDSLPYPDFDLYPELPYGVIQTSRGCPYECSYCASKIILPRFRRRSPGLVVDEIMDLQQQRGVNDFAFYDDALLANASDHFVPIMEEFLTRGETARFHTPNGLDSSEITRKVAFLMKQAGFTTLRLSLETSSRESLAHLRRNPDSVELLGKAVEHLRTAGFTTKQIGVYLLVGLPGQSIEEVRDGIETVIRAGAWPRLAEYSPIPRTKLWDEAIEQVKPLDIEHEPLYHNNSVYYRLQPEFRKNPFAALRREIFERLRNEK
jgi:radical SAM superfamily enzyme YgiQ (UPF0313 family)